MTPRKEMSAGWVARPESSKGVASPLRFPRPSKTQGVPHNSGCTPTYRTLLS
jgi:hypothetical protein